MAAAFGDARADAPVGELDIYIYIYISTPVYTHLIIYNIVINLLSVYACDI